MAKLADDKSSISAEEFSVAVSDVVRQFIEERHGFAAPKRTSEEFLHEILEEERLGKHQQTLDSFLKACDRAKFAKADLTVDDRELLLATANEVIDESITQGKDQA